MKDIGFGSIKETTTIDDEGSTITLKTRYQNYTAMKPIHKTYEIRTRVYTKQEEMAEWLKFSDEHSNDLDPSFAIEHSNKADDLGAYYVVKRWTTAQN